jgi:hypothetical protein
VLIIGAGDAGETLAREIEHRPQLGMKVVAFVDDHRAKWGSHIRGIKVYGPIASISQLADDLSADRGLIAIPSASGKRIREIIHHLAAADLPFKTMPGIDHLVSGKVQLSQLREVNVEDLLRRKRIDLPGDPVRKLFAGKRVLITGAGGSIGSELALQVAHLEPQSLASSSVPSTRCTKCANASAAMRAGCPRRSRRTSSTSRTEKRSAPSSRASGRRSCCTRRRTNTCRSAKRIRSSTSRTTAWPRIRWPSFASDMTSSASCSSRRTRPSTRPASWARPSAPLRSRSSISRGRAT